MLNIYLDLNQDAKFFDELFTIASYMAFCVKLLHYYYSLRGSTLTVPIGGGLCCSSALVIISIIVIIFMSFFVCFVFLQFI